MRIKDLPESDYADCFAFGGWDASKNSSMLRLAGDASTGILTTRLGAERTPGTSE